MRIKLTTVNLQPPSRSFRYSFSRLVIGVSMVILLITFVPLALNPAEASGLLNRPLHSVNEADYQGDLFGNLVPGVDISIIREVLMDVSPKDPGIDERVNAVYSGLLTPVPTSTPQFAETVVLARPVLTEQYPLSAAPTLAASPTRMSSASPTATLKPTETIASPRPSATLPTATFASPVPSPTTSRTPQPNRAPVISGLAFQTTAAGSLYTYKPAASDPDGDSLVFTISNRPAWAVFKSSDGSLSGTPTNADSGVHTITITVSDGSLSANFTFSLTVTYTNHPPVLSGPSSQTTAADHIYSFTPTASDPDGDSLTFSIADRPAWLTFNPATGNLSGTPTNANTGSLNLTITVSDGSLSASFTFALTVTYTNHAPTITGPETQTIGVGAAYSFTPTASDPDGDALAFSITDQPAWLGLDPATGELDGSPAPGDIGSNTITIHVSDGSLSASFTFTLIVTLTNQAPSIDPIAAQTIPAESMYSFTPTANDPDGNLLTYSITGQPAWLSIDPATGEISGTPTNLDAGSTSPVITVFDGLLTASRSFTLTVTYTNHAPTISGDTDQSIAAGSAYSFTPSASDPDGDTLTFSITNQPGWASFDPATGALTGTPSNADVGDNTITITVSDGDLSANLVISLAVTYTNHAPVISGSLVQSVTAASPYTFTPTASDPDGDTLTFTITNQPGWASFSSSDGTLSGTPGNPDIGTTSITIRASDGSLSADLTFALTVTPAAISPICTVIQAGTFSAPAAADSFLEMSNPTTINNNDNRIRVQVDSSGDTKHGLIIFDLSSIPPGTVITNASLYIHILTSNNNQTTSIYRLTTGWDEETVSWNNAQAGIAWNIPGGDYHPTVYSSFYPNVECVIRLDLTQLVQGWVNGAYPNYGMILISSGLDGEVVFVSSKATGLGENPTLVVDY